MLFVLLLPEVIDGDLIYNKQASVFIRINEVSDFDKNISIYPNPASGYVQIRFLSLPEYGAEIQLLDVTGKQIINRKLQSNLEVINIENLPVGVYFIKTSIKSQNNTTKLIII